MAFPFYGADGASGTVAVSNGSKNVTGTGTGWLTNNAVPTAGGYCIKMPDGQVYGIDACSADGALAMTENYRGSTISGGQYYIIPCAASQAKLLNQVTQLLNSSNFSQLAGLSPNSGDFVEYLGGTWVTRTPIQVLTNLLNSAGEVSIASASTTDIGAATSPVVQITGTTTITGLGGQANAVRLVRFGGALTLTHNATSLILPGGANIVTAAGDTALFVSDSAGHWRCWDYDRGDGRPLHLHNFPSFQAYKTAQSNDVTGDGTQYTVVFNQVMYDVTSSYNNATGEFTAPIAGKYMFTAATLLSGLTSSHTSGIILFVASGGKSERFEFAPNIYVSASEGHLTGVAVFDLAAGETVKVNVSVNNGSKVVDLFGSNTTSVLYTHFQGFMIAG